MNYNTPINTTQPQVQYPYNNIYDNNYLNRFNPAQQPLQPTPAPAATSIFLKCRPVSSKQEARATQIDLDGSLWVFTDIGHGQIFTKQIMPNGTAAFKTYKYVEEVENNYDTNQYVTRDEFNKVVQSLVAAIQPKNSEEPAQVTQNTNAAIQTSPSPQSTISLKNF